MKKLLGIVVLGLLWCNVSYALDVFAKNKILDYNFVCTSLSKGLVKDWSKIWDKFGFIRFGSGTNKILLFSSWDDKNKHYNFHTAVVKKENIEDEDIKFNYYWARFFESVTYKNGEKGPLILFNMMSKYKRHDLYHWNQKRLKITKEQYETLKRFDDDAYQYAKNDKKKYISAMERNRTIIFNLAGKSLDENKLDEKYNLACKIE